VYKEFVRPLSDSERRFFNLESVRLKNLSSREFGPKSILTTLLVGLVAGAAFGLFANYPWYWGALLGSIAGFLLKLIAGFEHYKDYRQFIVNSDNAKEVKVIEIEAKRFIEFKEFEDLGVIYCFEIEPSKFFVLNGQEYYETPRFPCLSFEIIEIKGLLYTIRPKSRKESPNRTVLEDVSRDLEFYENEVVVEGDFENIEESLKKYKV
jgi:hypothetical protein